MKKIGTTVFWEGYGFLSRLGPKLADWEHVLYPEDNNIDGYEINLRHRRK